ncbi:MULTISPECIES: hypothetical protein [Serratia]|uniref:hypothetical protein n=1 Tax=Serratia TaxID=613 RepID=UPI0018D70D5A|nr:hypothetical protein [Serratia marcescens]MBH2806024.1 hypothetical protein [Serratia marcescens]MBH2959357.1 hypothetical protein [Serratia marcescens]MBN5233473.1 hypothetical protein [Serratia marcescens]
MLILYASAQEFTDKSDLFYRQESLTRALCGFSPALGYHAKHLMGDIAQSPAPLADNARITAETTAIG